MAKTDKSELERVRAELICSICLDLLCEPKKLNCDHSFCQECLESHVRISPCATPDGQTGEGRQGGGGGQAVVECACCREKTPLPENGVAGLRTNFKLKSLVDILSHQERQKMVQDLGKGHQHRSEKHVPSCTVDGHKSEQCNFYCKKCNKLFCRFCFPEHRHHDWENWDLVLSQCKEELRGSIQPAYEAAQRASDAVKTLEDDMNEVTQNCNLVKSKMHEYFKLLASELQSREETLLGMVDRYAEVKMDSLQKFHDQLKSGETSLLQHIKSIETQMQADSAELLTQKDTVKSKMVLHRNTIQKALPRADDVDTFIELKTEAQVPPIPTLGHLVFCQKHPRTKMVSTVRNFVETEDMKHIHLDLARPFADESTTAPAYMQFRMEEDPTLIDYDTYEDLAPAQPATTSSSTNRPRSSIPLPPAPLDIPQPALVEESDISSVDSTYAVVNEPRTWRGSGSSVGGHYSKGRNRSKTNILEEDPYDTIPAHKSATLPGSLKEGTAILKERLYTIRRKPDIIEPESVVNLQNQDVQVSGIICTQRYGNIVVTDTKNKCIQILDEGEIISTIGAPEVEFTKPVTLATDSSNDLFILDQANSMFYKFRLNGDCLFSFPTKPRKTPQKPWDMAVSPDGAIYISDWSRRRVYVYNGVTGKKIRSIKGCYRRGKKDEFVEFSRPAGIAFDLGGRLMVADRGDRCVWCINTEGDEFIKTIGDTHLQDPYGIAVATDGKIVVSESESDCISVFDDDGELLHYFGGTGTEVGQFCRPHHVFVDAKMRIYVADTENKRVQIFNLLEESIYQNLIPVPVPVPDPS